LDFYNAIVIPHHSTTSKPQNLKTSKPQNLISVSLYIISQTMKANDFLCPYCRGHLMPHQKVILSARKESGKRGIILLNPQLGEYDVHVHHTFKLVEGEHIDMLCPLCHANLTDHTISQNLARIKMIDAAGMEYDIYFSEIFGEKCTFKISGDKKIEKFGDDPADYQNYWGATPGY
jgi:hypothetical protein